jgi:hypothetical protein
MNQAKFWSQINRLNLLFKKSKESFSFEISRTRTSLQETG